MAIRAIRTAERPDEYHSGIPNRDLTEDEYQALTDEQRDTVQNSVLYAVRPAADVGADLRREREQADKAPKIGAEKAPAALDEPKPEGGELP